MSGLKPVTGAQKIVVPDLRFEQTFQKALRREANKNQKASSQGHITADTDSVISASVICKVVLRDVLLMPFLQGILWTSALIALKPWLRMVMVHGRLVGRRIYELVLGKDLVRKRA
ncbi:LAQU0S10e03202g1_1 [Lachancea quebecensis]|uniref:LAQU0S10e03202g1_1 n=1 Tax=Lachancea quebecensis TaxID=1654605 RepID=A0A0P1KU51_9SACH|nr:LAQU0S10e03202g1_1 [Lachancea quebecensis]